MTLEPRKLPQVWPKISAEALKSRAAQTLGGAVRLAHAETPLEQQLPLVKLKTLAVKMLLLLSESKKVVMQVSLVHDEDPATSGTSELR